ncbi:MAG TPA: 4'-phosphopantetheinyl transferase superfamily protein [Pyrinomonadaceae bacterium]|jgi:4'-phosphopantetheinyl transferase|nr:4'-phosphopantetheinyl transferase superfamily protein [Pyrinomonadaceae bacterium]
MTEVAPLFDYADRSALLSAAVPQTWKTGPAQPAIWQNEVHIWRARLDVPWSWTFDAALSLEDRTRADRFKFESDRRKFCAARASLRLILSRYLGMKPGRIPLETGEFGKPFIADKNVAQGLRFNLSHSHQVALISVARDREVGVDIEFMRSDFVTDDVANHFFSPAEVAEFRNVQTELRTRSFFNCWTRKEAYIKARGEGLYCPLDQFDVSVMPDAPAMLLESRVDPADTDRWIFNEISAGERYAATVAIEKKFSRLVLWDFLEEAAVL